MVRKLALSLGAGLAVAAATVCGADETFPVVHNDSIVVRVLSGNDGAPMAHLHLSLLAGYDAQEISRQAWREEAITDEQGETKLSKQFVNLPFLQVWADKMPTCQIDPRGEKFSVERIRRDGLSASNRCGVVQEPDAPGVFTVYVNDKKKTVKNEQASTEDEAAEEDE